MQETLWPNSSQLEEEAAVPSRTTKTTTQYNYLS